MCYEQWLVICPVLKAGDHERVVATGRTGRPRAGGRIPLPDGPGDHERVVANRFRTDRGPQARCGPPPPMYKYQLVLPAVSVFYKLSNHQHVCSRSYLYQ